ncbi:MAG: agmatinase [Candidatus Thermoplasmatota archaeon]|nr:agmatinase [Candidatus Thermoplasmatota archaeon]
MIESLPQDLPSYFADAETSYPDSLFVIFGVCYDKTSTFRKGSRHGPEAIRTASWNFESYNLLTKVNFKNLPVHDYGNILLDESCSPSEMVQTVNTVAERFMKDGKVPILLGGEHSISPAVIHAFPKTTAVISLDAHLDFREDFKGERNNHACTIRRISDHIPVDHILVCGVRSAEKQEYDEATDLGLEIIDSVTIHKKGTEPILSAVQRKLSQKDIYLTIDIDAVDPGFAPGTGTPEPFGMIPFHILTLIDSIADRLIGFDVVEVSPAYDHGETAMLAAKLVRYGIERIAQKKGLV